MKQKITVFDVYELYVVYINSIKSPKSAQNIINQLRSVLLRVWLTEMGYQRISQNPQMTKEDVQSALSYLKQLEVDTLLNGRQTLQQAFAKLNVSKSSQSNYGSVFEKFLIWFEQQDWGLGCLSRSAKVKDECSPIWKTHHGGILNTPLMDRPGGVLKYGLTYKEISSSLQRELDNLYHYLTDSEYPGRVIERVGETTAKCYIQEVRLVLGWYYRYYRPSISHQNLVWIYCFRG
ncbi:hypothetical protein IQ264_27930 [Phormidium sp. LEGE 05292]|uniref:hypothetical protein n=1 Tax=[Phormidium] sp. LEGE 05292 TaxID=767427 RepID=UPI0018825CF6|nr:hypothetical protein [Phormidium sp. LEGE 05292]MBE9229238.1 hypothetical protein [Phormidium sp. LEGE 05292]